jgi:hypothetical protein
MNGSAPNGSPGTLGLASMEIIEAACRSASGGGNTISPREQSGLEKIRGKIACLLAECGFAETAGACRIPARSAAPESGGGVNMDEVVRAVMESLQRK